MDFRPLRRERVYPGDPTAGLEVLEGHRGLSLL